jgi:hypothetical protein
VKTFQLVCTPAGEAIVQYYMVVDGVKKVVVSRGKEQGEDVRGIWKLYWFDPQEITEIKKKAPK